jgi:rod shape determining protein RodA
VQVRNPASAWRHLDLTLLLSTLAIAGMGLLMVYSATRQKQESAGLDPAFFLKRQAVYLLLGLVAMAVVALVDYRHIRDYTPVLFGVIVVTLLLVISPLGTSRRGTQAWFQLGMFQFQPSEVAKVVLILALAAVCAGHRGELETPRLIAALGLAFVPMALIYAQPDLGTNMVFVGIVIAVLLVAGARPRHIAVLTLLGITAIALVVELGMLRTTSATGSPPSSTPRATASAPRTTCASPRSPSPPAGWRAGACSRAPRPTCRSCPSSTPTSSSPRSARSWGSSGASPSSACSGW